jgi:hypothetical protein
MSYIVGRLTIRTYCVYIISAIFLQKMNYHSIGNSIKSSETLVDEVFHVLLLFFFNPYAYAKEICSHILQSDKSIRFAGIANNMGTLIAYKLWEGIVSVLNEEELQNNIMKTVLRMKTREDYESKFGDVIYTFALYKGVK